MTTAESVRWNERARQVIPHATSSFARARTNGLFFASAEGAHLTDIDGNVYVDCVLGFGPAFLGHRPPEVVAAVQQAIGRIDLMAGQTTAEVELAERIVQHVPSAQKVLMVSSGTEAVQMALRIAKATTGRNVVVKFEGHYHGWIDPMYSNAPGAETPAASAASADFAAGVRVVTPNVVGARAAQDLVVLDWNDLDTFNEFMRLRGDEVAAVIMEPVPFNMGAFLPEPGYLEGVQQACRAHGALLVFDEVVSGFRLGFGGAQGMLGVTPDLAVFAKALGSGFPIAAVVGSDAAFESVLNGPVRQAGTYNASPIGVAAGHATLDILERDDVFARVETHAAMLESGLGDLASRHSVPFHVNRVGGVLQTFWGLDAAPRTYAQARETDATRIRQIFEGAANHGAYLAPRGLLFVSAAHDADDIATVLTALERSLP